MSFGDYGNFSQMSQNFDDQFNKGRQEMEKRFQENKTNFEGFSRNFDDKFNNGHQKIKNNFFNEREKSVFDNIGSDFEAFSNNLRTPSNLPHSNSFPKFQEDFNPIQGTVFEAGPMPKQTQTKEEMVSEVVTKEWNILEKKGELSKLSPEDKETLKIEMNKLADAIYEVCLEQLSIVYKPIFEGNINSYKLGETSLHTLRFSKLPKEEQERIRNTPYRYDDI